MKTGSVMILILLSCTLFLAHDFHLVKASGTIYIRADGSIDPPTAPIQRNGNVYTLTGNIISDAEGIVVERDNIVIDGAGYTVEGIVEGADESKGIDLSSRVNVTITNTRITSFSYSYGIYLYSSSNNSISGNNITANWWGILLYSSSNNSINGNNIANNAYGIRLFGSSNNTIAGNVFADGGLSVYDSYENLVEDNVVDGKPLVYLEGVSDVIIDYAGQVILVNSINVTVENIDLSITSAGVQLIKTNNSSICGNTIARNEIGILLIDSLNNSVSGNSIANNYYGIWLGSSYKNRISGNIIANNQVCGIRLDSSSNNTVCHNNLVTNPTQVSNSGSTNVWDDGYPSGGNYWGHLPAVDEKSGPNQDQPGADGIIDTQYVIDDDNVDHYPLVALYYSTDVNDDGIVNMIDITIVAVAFNSRPGGARWNFNADVDKNGIVNIMDVTMVAKDYGKTV